MEAAEGVHDLTIRMYVSYWLDLIRLTINTQNIRTFLCNYDKAKQKLLFIPLLILRC